jgi:hypothetical protein
MLRRPLGGSASATARSFRFAPFPRRCYGTFCQPWSCCASPYSGWQNVIYSRNVMRNVPKFIDKLLTIEIKTFIVTKMMGYEIFYHFLKA